MIYIIRRLEKQLKVVNLNNIHPGHQLQHYLTTSSSRYRAVKIGSFYHRKRQNSFLVHE